jgi:hypothetical protein
MVQASIKQVVSTKKGARALYPYSVPLIPHYVPPLNNTSSTDLRHVKTDIPWPFVSNHAFTDVCTNKRKATPHTTTIL